MGWVNFCVQLTSSDKQMSLRRSLSDTTKLHIDLDAATVENQRLKDEVQRLRDEVERLTSTQARSKSIAEVSAAVANNLSLSEFLHRESRVHPGSSSKQPKKKPPSKKSHLKGVAPGALLTQSHIIQGIKVHEQKEREVVAKKEADKVTLQEIRKRERADSAAEKKRKKAEDSTISGQVKRQRGPPALATEEGKGEAAASDAAATQA